MKRITIALLLTFALLISLSSCHNSEKNETLIKLNELSEKLENSYTLNICTVSEDGHEVNTNYTVTDKNGVISVNAKIETVNTFDIDGDTITAPDSYVTVTERELTDEEIKDGNFILPKFSFSSNNLSSIAIINGTLDAKVSSLKALTGIMLDASNARLTVKYTDEAISIIIINFVTSQNNTVTLTYTF